MIKKLTLWIILMPLIAIGQQQDSLAPQKKKFKKQDIYRPYHAPKPLPEETKPDFKKESIFKALFVAGINLAQVDGDLEFGYKKYGAHIGVGTVVKFSKLFSTSVELVYSMKGARPKYGEFSNGAKDHYDITWDYVDIPFSINIHDKKVVMFGAGLQVSVLARYNQTDSAGNNVTANPEPHGQQPRKIDLMAQVGVTFFIKQRIGIGARFSYSLLKVRDSVAPSSLRGEYNNVITLRLSYLLDPKNARWKKK